MESKDVTLNAVCSLNNLRIKLDDKVESSKFTILKHEANSLNSLANRKRSLQERRNNARNCSKPAPTAFFEFNCKFKGVLTLPQNEPVNETENCFTHK